MRKVLILALAFLAGASLACAQALPVGPKAYLGYCLATSGANAGLYIPIAVSANSSVVPNPPTAITLYGFDSTNYDPVTCDSSGNLNFGSFPKFAAAPSHCSAGQVYFNTVSTTPYYCSATDTWTAFGSGSSMTWPTTPGYALWSSGTSWATPHLFDATGLVYTTEPFYTSYIGTASQSSLYATGAPYTGGTATTNFPLAYLNGGGAVSSFSTSGTEFGINAPSGFTGNFLDFHVNGGASVGKVDYTGKFTFATAPVFTGLTGYLYANGASQASAATTIPLGSIVSTAGTLAPLVLANATSGLLSLQPADGAITSYTIELPVAQPTSSNTLLSCTAANPAVCTWTGNAPTASSATKSTNIAGGAAGSIPVQSAADTTTFATGNSTGSTDAVLTSTSSGGAYSATAFKNAPAVSLANVTAAAIPVNVSTPGLTLSAVTDAAAPTGAATNSGQSVPASTTNQAVLTCIDSSGVNTTNALNASANVTTTGGSSFIVWTYGTVPTGCTTPYLWLKNTGSFAYYHAVSPSQTTWEQDAAYTTYTPAASYPVAGVLPAANTTGLPILQAIKSANALATGSDGHVTAQSAAQAAAQIAGQDIEPNLVSSAMSPINVTNPGYGAKGDERMVSDASINAGSYTLHSATAAFTSSDNARTFTVEMGSRIMANGTYQSGGTISGPTGGFCSLSAFNGASGVTGNVWLTSTDTIAAGSDLIFTNVGSGIATAPTSATLGNGIAATGTVNTVGAEVSWISGGMFSPNWVGYSMTIGATTYTIQGVEGGNHLTLATSAGSQTGASFTITGATCSGTATISTNLFAKPVTTTGTIVNSTTVTLGTAATNNVSGANAWIGTDDTAAFLAAISVAALKGGTVYAPEAQGCPTGYTGVCQYLILGQLTFPVSTYSPCTFDGGACLNQQAPVYIAGDGPSFLYPGANQVPPATPFGGTILDMRSTTSPAKIVDLAQGYLDISAITLTDNGWDTNPYVLTTNTVLHAHDMYVDDNAILNGWHAGTWLKDAFVIGGQDAVPSNLTTAPFFGYGSSIERVGFGRIQRGVLTGAWASSIAISDNVFYATGGSDSTAAAIELNAGTNAPLGGTLHNHINDNLIEMLGRAYGIKFTVSSDSTIAGNYYGDASNYRTIAFDRFEVNSTGNIVSDEDSHTYSYGYPGAQCAWVSSATNDNFVQFTSVPPLSPSGLRTFCNPWFGGIAAAIPLVLGPFAIESAPGANWPAYEIFDTNANANTRNWALVSTYEAYGTLCVNHSNLIGGDPLAAGTPSICFGPTGGVNIGDVSDPGAGNLTVGGAIKWGSMTASPVTATSLSATFPFTLNGSASGLNTYIQLLNNSSPIAILGSGSSLYGGDPAANVGLWVYGTNQFDLSTNGVKRFSVAGYGGVGIGITPSSPLLFEVNGTSEFVGEASFEGTSSSISAAGTIQADGGATVMDHCVGGTMDGAYIAASSTQATACTVGGGTLIVSGFLGN